MPDVVGIVDARAHGPSRQTDRRSTPRHDAAFIHAGLARIIEGEILPRLALAHRESRQPHIPISQSPTSERVAAFAQALMRGDPDEAQAHGLLEEGLPLDVLLLDLLATAAHHLGRLWEEDEADFVDVTVALGRLHGFARTLCTQLETGEASASTHRVLLMPCPGETHLFSLALVASFFREAGWDVVLSSGASQDMIALVGAERFDVVGISLSCDVLLPAMAALVTGLRAASCNPDIRVLVGGPLFLRDPTSAIAVGADAAAEDGRSAVRVAEALVAECPDRVLATSTEPSNCRPCAWIQAT